jgi:hypothetical protein
MKRAPLLLLAGLLSVGPGLAANGLALPSGLAGEINYFNRNY